MYEQPGTASINCKNPCNILGRWLGAGAAVPTVVAKTTRSAGNPSNAGGGQISISRSGVGALSVTIPGPLGIVQDYAFWTATGASASDKNVRVTPPGAGSLTFALAVTLYSNGAAVDLASNDELLMYVTMAYDQNP